MVRKPLFGLVAVLGAVALALAGIVRRGSQWGATAREQSMPMPGDGYLDGDPQARTVMTRAISISASPEVVWPWLAQMGRGAGWYSYDHVDNGGKPSAQHIVSWIPDPQVGDASAIGWLRELHPGKALTWWLPGDDAFGTTMRMVVDVRLDPDGPDSRLVVRVSGDATGTVGLIVVRMFELADSIMAVRQLQGIKHRSERFADRTVDSAAPETGDRDQYQLYETIWVSGERAGIAGSERAARWHDAAREASALN